MCVRWATEPSSSRYFECVTDPKCRVPAVPVILLPFLQALTHHAALTHMKPGLARAAHVYVLLVQIWCMYSVSTEFKAWKNLLHGHIWCVFRILANPIYSACLFECLLTNYGTLAYTKRCVSIHQDTRHTREANLVPT